MPGQGMDVLREQTDAFIRENPAMIVFNRHERVGDGAGGYISNPTPLPPQRVRVVTESRVVSVERRNVNGAVVRPDANIVAPYDADVQRGDTFRWQGMDMEVVWVSDIGYERLCEVATK